MGFSFTGPLIEKDMEKPNLSVYDSYGEKQLLAAIYSFTCITGVIGNSVVLLAPALSRKPRTPTNVFVVNLADLFTCLSLPLNVLASAE